MIRQLITDARKIVIKIGSNTLAGEDGKINFDFITQFAQQAADLINKGKQIIIVSSGAQVAGLSTMGKWARKKDLHYRQALCAVGQVELMDAWRRAFSQAACPGRHSSQESVTGSNIHIAQILLTRDDFNDTNRTLNMRNTLFTLVDEGIIPVINENDTVSVEEIKIGDNDTLAARSAILWSADLLILLSDIDGLYNKNPKCDAGAVLLEEVRNISEARKNIVAGEANSFGTGGISTKLDAAELVLSYGIPAILADGGKPNCIEALAAGNQKGTVFLP